LAGHVPTVSLIGNTVLSLLQNQQEFQIILDGDNNSLIPLAVEETLRYRSPVQAVLRISTYKVNTGGRDIQAGERILAYLGSANHDESIFPDPERFTISRNSHSYSHLGFGHGVGFCPGAPLARLETCVALKIIIERLRNLKLDDHNVGRMKPLPSLSLYGICCLPVLFEPKVKSEVR
jgi:cytochrome P450